jgi:ribosomal protein L11 methyltransferase
MSSPPESASDQTRWLEVSVQANLEVAEAISEVLNRYVSGGTVIEQMPEEAPGEPSPPLSPSVCIKAYLDADDTALRQRIEEALWHLSQLYPFGLPRFKELADQDWQTAWRQDYQVQQIGQGIAVVPSWLDYSAESDQVVLTIDPGMAFGTGLHPSTRLCLIGLERLKLAERSLLDVGAGSGILSIYAAKRDAAPVVALEKDPIAAQVAAENMRANGVASQVEVVCGTLTEAGFALEDAQASPFAGPFEVIVINILAEVIAELTPALVAHLTRSGRVLASGIIQDRESVVQSAWADHDLDVVTRRQEGDWVLLVGARC